MPAQVAVLALGSNMEGPFGGPVKTFAQAVVMLAAAGLRVHATSRVYLTDPVGPGWQAPYHNAAVVGVWSKGTLALLQVAKRIERRCGRRPGPVWGRRVLDIDIVNHGARIVGWPLDGRATRSLVLPHRYAATRPFVTVPLSDIVPNWRHPVTGARVCDMVRRDRGRRGRVIRVLPEGAFGGG